MKPHTKAGLVFLAVCLIIATAIYFAVRPADQTEQSEASADGNDNTQSGSNEGPAYALRSNVSGASLVRLDELPSIARETVSEEDPCFDRIIQPTSSGGRRAAERGWHILQEDKLGDVTAVLIVRGMTFMGSGMCQSRDANVALFSGQRLIGVLFAKGSSGIDIANLQPIDGAMRVWSFEPSLQGQLNRKDSSITFDSVMSDDTDLVCNQRLPVPAVFNLQYSKARGMIIAARWAPFVATPDPQDTLDFAADRRVRFPEVNACSGTGLAGCDFKFSHPDSAAILTVTTLGESEDPGVSSYSVDCDGGRQ